MKFVKRISRWPMLAGAMSIMAVSTLWGGQPAFAQGPQPGRPSIGLQAFNACSTTDYTDTVAKALGISAADLRKDIVNGQPLQDIAAGDNVTLQALGDAIRAARKPEVDQAVKDSVLTQDEATAMQSAAGALPATAPAPNGNGENGPGPNGNNGNGPGRTQGAALALLLPDIGNMRILLQPPSDAASGPGNGPRGGGTGGGFGVGLFNLVRPYAVTAQTLNLKCTDLVKTLITPPGKSIVAVAADQKAEPQSLSDALTKAYKDALAQDVTETVITQAQSDQLSANLDKAVSAFVNNPTPMRPALQPTQAR